MPHRQTYQRRLPKLWLMTDPRFGDGLIAALRKLPMRSGVVFRHYDLPIEERHALYLQVWRACRKRGHLLLLAGDAHWSADGTHGRGKGKGLISMPVHNAQEIGQAKRCGADLMFLSPLFATRSHPGARPLGAARFAHLANLARPAKVIALGGMTRNRARSLDAHLVHGWAAIDAFKI
jgi:thiamine-phosphate pyrophosphorylase